ncbi:MAG: hypothetical protein EXS35_11740 [Pedosphaera sp.]|nr:hypothetical protein [Pedosphaera sp.]
MNWAQLFCAGVLTRPRVGLNFPRMAAASQVQNNLRDAMKEALRIQNRFVAEPLFAKTGRGYLKSEGVATLQKIKSSLRCRTASKSK